MKILRTIILTVSLLTFLSVPALAQSRIATVDLPKIFDGYWKTKQARIAYQEYAAQADKDVKDVQANLQKVGDDYQQLLEQANDQAISSDERAKRQQAADDKLKELKSTQAALDELERATTARLTQRRQQMISDLLKEIKVVVTAKAQAGGYALVIDTAAETANGTPAVVYDNDENDLTDAVITQLNLGAPVGTISAPASTNANTP